MKNLLSFFIAFFFVNITEAQNVGIGTINPQAILHISSPSAEALRIQAPSAYISFYDNSLYTGYMQSSASTMSVGSIGANRLSLATNFTERLTMLSNGNVGINNNTPLVNFHISSTTGEVARIQGPNGFMTFYDNANYKGYIQASGSGLAIAAQGASSSLGFVTNFTQRALLTPDGNFGIGTATPPNSLLEVSGSYNSYPLVKLSQFGTDAPALKITASSGANGGLELENAAIKVSGTNKAAFQVTNPFNGATFISIPTTSYANSPTDILFVTFSKLAGGPSLNTTTGVYWTPPFGSDPGIWRIYTLDSSPIPVGVTFNVLVIKQ